MAKYKTVLQSLMERQAEVSFGRLFVRTICYALGVGAFILGAVVTDLVVSAALGLMACLLFVAYAQRISLRFVPGVRVTAEELLQIEREEGWYDKGLLELFYLKHGAPSPAQYDEDSIAALALSGSNFDAVAEGIIRGRDNTYPLGDVSRLVEASCKMRGEVPTSFERGVGFSVRALAYVTCSFFLSGLGVSLCLMITMMQVSGRM